jgi:uncharacterized membrane protein
MLLAAGAPAGAAVDVLVEHPAGILALLLAVLATIFWASQNRALSPIFKVIPSLVFCYFIPTTLTTLGVIPAESPLYSWIRGYLLPAALFLLILSLDVPAILRLGPRAGVMLLAGTAGVVIGGPLALLICQPMLAGPTWGLDPDSWRGLAALSGSWIGGGANFLALGDIFEATPKMMAMMVVPDVFVANIWMGILLYLAGRQHAVDRWTGADASAIRALEKRLTDFQQRVMRVPTLADLMIILALGFGMSWIGYWSAQQIGAASERTVVVAADNLGVTHVHMASVPEPVPRDHPDVKALHIGRAIERKLAEQPAGEPAETGVGSVQLWFARFVNENTGASMWKYVIVTTLGVILSFTAARNLEGAGASRVGSAMLYLLVACIGASADFHEMLKAPGYMVVGAVWMGFHVVVLLTVGWLIKAPIFFVAVGSQANIGGAASAPIVASAYHPSLAPVGVLLAVAGYVLGTYAGALCGTMLKWAAGG